jgi:proline iminopeptidase
MPEMRALYPPIEPYETGTIEVGDGHSLYFERVGTRGAKPAVFLHGGPGGGISPSHRRLFDPSRYDVLLFDQRGCGRSLPHASITANTTWHLVADIERLRQHVGVDKWLVFGGSWGSTLGLAYAQEHPDRVSALILRGVFTLTKAEIDWFYQFGVSEIFPDKWARFKAVIPKGERHDILAAYHHRLTGADLVVQFEAAMAWTIFESETVALMPELAQSAPVYDARSSLALARLESYYFINQGWLEEGQLLTNAVRLRGIPGVIVHGRYDMPCPARYAFAVHHAWPDAEFHLIEGAGHAWTEPAILDRLIRATDQFASQTFV